MIHPNQRSRKLKSGSPKRTLITGLTSEMRRAKADQLQYELVRGVARRSLAAMRVKPLTDIWIYPDYPNGYKAVVGAEEELVYILQIEWGKAPKLMRRKCLGVRPNGALIYS